MIRGLNPPANDNFANAQGMLPIKVAGTTIDATLERDESDRLTSRNEPLTATIWYFWIPIQSGQFVISTCDSTIDSQVDVYTGATLRSLEAAATALKVPCEDT